MMHSILCVQKEALSTYNKKKMSVWLKMEWGHV